jgi:membrane protease YdiL (CAAX protease family)
LTGLWWAAVAVSAGICEELVFRGWFLATLRSELGMGGLSLLIAAAAIFGLAHVYQGVSGVILTAVVGAFFCVSHSCRQLEFRNRRRRMHERAVS